jgi:hypothetical protein
MKEIKVFLAFCLVLEGFGSVQNKDGSDLEGPRRSGSGSTTLVLTNCTTLCSFSHVQSRNGKLPRQYQRGR